MLRTLCFVVACLPCQWAGADSIHKCIEAGRVSYGDRPCRGAGTTIHVPALPAPDPAAAARHARNLAALKALEQTRLAAAKRASDQLDRVRRAGHGQRRRCDRLRLQQQWAVEDLARQRGDARETARLKTRRQADALALECPA